MFVCKLQKFPGEAGFGSTRVLPIVVLDVGAIGSISLSALVQAIGILLNIR